MSKNRDSLEPMDTRDDKSINVLMLPWLAHGHISPFLDLARTLSKRNFSIYICSTPINLSLIKKKITENCSNAIQLVELDLPSFPDLPPQYHTTNGLPPRLMDTLKMAFENSSRSFSNILKSLQPDLVIYDFSPVWAADIALSNNIPAVQFLTVSALAVSFTQHKLRFGRGKNFPFPLSLHRYFIERINNRFKYSMDELKNKDPMLEATERSCKLLLIRTSREIEEKYINYASVLSGKKITPLGPLVQEMVEVTDDHREIISWLDRKDISSVVFVSFGSEYFLSKEEIEEIACGLELSNLNFIWVVRFPYREKMKLEEALPIGFLDKIGERGVIRDGWAPQMKILGHSSTGGFVSHCGWSSTMESMKFGVPIIAMPMQIDQPLNARLVKEVGIGVEVERNESGRFDRGEIAKVIREVVVEKSGQVVRRKAKEISEMIREKGEAEIDEVVEELVKLCKEKRNT